MPLLMLIMLAIIFGPAIPAPTVNSQPDELVARSQLPQRIMALPEVEAAIVSMTNDLRQQNGLRPLIEDSTCRRTAREYSFDMLRRQFFSHVDPEGLSLTHRLPLNRPMTMMGENIWTGKGFAPSQTQRLAQIIFVNWIYSPSHRKNILTPEYTHLGVGVASRGEDVRATQIFWGLDRISQ